MPPAASTKERMAMAADTSIYEYICNHIEDGRLPENFKLEPFDEPDSALRFADGAMDGISIYHMASAVFPNDIGTRIADALADICLGKIEDAEPALASMMREHRAIRLIGQIQRAVLDNTDRIGPGALMRYAAQLLFTSRDKEMVKLGLSLMELFDNPIDELKETVRELGLCNEFTIFAAWCARNWEHGNDEVFAMARKVKGWGRIHCVEMLEPETPEIRDWLLREGACNYVMPEYSAATCMAKAGVAARLEKPLSAADLDAVSFLLEHSVREDGPLAALPLNGNTRKLIELYLDRVAEQVEDIRCGKPVSECLRALAAYCESAGWSDMAEHCRSAGDIAKEKSGE